MPKSLHSKAKELVASLIEYFEKERDNNGPLLPLSSVRERVAEALKLNISTVSQISSAVKSNTPFTSPPKKRHRPKKVLDTRSLNVTSIRDVIYEMYSNKKHVTLTSIHEKVQARQLFEGSKASLHRLLKEIGFKCQKDNPRRGLMELPEIARKRISFLKQYKTIKEKASHQLVFLDETWIFQNGTVGRSRQDNDAQSVRSLKTDGKRYIVLYAGCENGFIPGADLIFASKSTVGDYHGEMIKENFTHWFEERLLKNVETPSVIVLDNAPYHNTLLSKIPNTSWRKDEIIVWLRDNNMQFSENDFKAELLIKVAQNKPAKVYHIDQLAEQYSHFVLRLPPYHCIFNPIEHIWGITKSYYNRHIGRDGRTIENCLNMLQEALQSITPEVWSNSVKHTESIIYDWYEREKQLDVANVAPIIINLEEDESSSNDSD